MARRTWMAWVFLGASCRTREDHRAWFGMAKQMACDGYLPTLAQLEAQALTMGQVIDAEAELSITTSEALFFLLVFVDVICFARCVFVFSSCKNEGSKDVK